MPHPVLFRLQVTEVVGVGCHLDGHVLDDLESVGPESHTLHGVVGEQSHLMDAQVAQHLGSAAVVALIGLEAEVDVGIDGVEAFFLQLIGRYLVHQADAATFLLQKIARKRQQ